MNDDLISRKAVIDYLREQNNNVIIEKYKDGFESEDTCRGMESAISAFRNFILTLPTAFDKEKVKEQIQIFRSKFECTCCPKNIGKHIPVSCDECMDTFAKVSIVIVEKGGIE